MNRPATTPKRDQADVIAFENNLLGSIMLDPSQMDAMSGRLSQQDFFDAELGQLFAILTDRHDAGLPISDASLLLESAKPIFGDASAATLGELATRGTDCRSCQLLRDRDRDGIKNQTDRTYCERSR